MKRSFKIFVSNDYQKYLHKYSKGSFVGEERPSFKEDENANEANSGSLSCDEESSDSFESSPRSANGSLVDLPLDVLTPFIFEARTSSNDEIRTITWLAHTRLLYYGENFSEYSLRITVPEMPDLLNFNFRYLKTPSDYLMIWSVISGTQRSKDGVYYSHFFLSGLNNMYDVKEFREENVHFLLKVVPNIEDPFATKISLRWEATAGIAGL